MRSFLKRREAAPKTYDPAQFTPVIRASICTGEKVAGFRGPDGHIREVMLIRSEKDREEFRRTYGIQGEIETIY